MSRAGEGLDPEPAARNDEHRPARPDGGADASFADARGGPIALVARDAEDLAVISALIQDAVLPATEMTWDRRGRRFAMLLNRFRWEDAAARAGRPFERVQSVLIVDDVMRVATRNLPGRGAGPALSLLSASFEPGEECAGRVILTLAGGAAIAAHVEALEVTLKDVSRPYLAPSGHRPAHP